MSQFIYIQTSIPSICYETRTAAVSGAAGVDVVLVRRCAVAG